MRIVAPLGALVLAVLAGLFYLFVDIRTIPNDEQRYPTAGDWWTDSQGWHLRVSRLPKRRYEWLVSIHEFVELALCQLTGVSQARVDAFDLAYEARRKGKEVLIPGKADALLFDDPGDDPVSPYHYQHAIASWTERVAAVLLFVDWCAYNESLDELWNE